MLLAFLSQERAADDGADGATDDEPHDEPPDHPSPLVRLLLAFTKKPHVESIAGLRGKWRKCMKKAVRA